MGQYALIIVAAALLAAGVILEGIGTDTSRADNELNQYHAYVAARDLAITGLHMTVGRLARDKECWSAGSGYEFAETPYATGRFRTVVRPFMTTCDTVDVEAIGILPYITRRGEGRDTLVILEARYSREYADGGVPPAFRNAITTDLGLSLAGSIHIHAPGVYGQADAVVLNSNIHTNQDLTLQGSNQLIVEGYASYAVGSTIRGQPTMRPREDFGAPYVVPGDYIPIDEINVSNLLANASYVCPSSCALDGTFFASQDPPITSFGAWATSLGAATGTSVAPFIYFAQGDLALSGDINLGGHGIIVASGNINFAGGSNIEGGFDDQGSIMQIATLGNIDLAGNNIIRASLYGLNAIGLNGTILIEGGIVTKSFNNNGGNIEIIYRGPSDTITDPGFQFVIPIGPVLIAYTEGWWTPRVTP